MSVLCLVVVAPQPAGATNCYTYSGIVRDNVGDNAGEVADGACGTVEPAAYWAEAIAGWALETLICFPFTPPVDWASCITPPPT